MANDKTVSNEQIIAALITSGTRKQAAVALGVSERALYNRMNNGDFQAEYKATKADLLRGAVFDMNQHLQAAVQTIVEVMANKDNNPAVRMQAAQLLLSNSAKFEKCLKEAENGVAFQIESNKMFHEI